MREIMRMVGEFTAKISRVKPMLLKNASHLNHDMGASALSELGRSLLTKYLKAAPHDIRLLRAHLLVEELSETLTALEERNELALLDALADLTYVTAGTALAFDLPLPEAIEEVHRSNMTKVPSCGQDGGRVLWKGTQYSPPKLKEILDAYRAGRREELG